QRPPGLFQGFHMIAVRCQNASHRPIITIHQLANTLVLPLPDVNLIRGLLVNDEDVFHGALRPERRSCNLRMAVSVLRSAMRPSRHAESASGMGTKRMTARSSTGLPSSSGLPAWLG